MQTLAQVVAQPTVEPPEPVTDFNNVWVAAMNRRPCDDPPYTEAEKQWLRELTGRHTTKREAMRS